MSKKKESTKIKYDKELNRRFLDDYLFNFLDEKGYVIIVMMTEGRIAGFSPQNYHKVPLPILKNVAKKQVKKLSNIILFLNVYVDELKETYESLLLEDFRRKIEHEKDLCVGEQFALFYLLYPDVFAEKQALIKENIANELPPLHSVVSLPFSDKLKALTKISEHDLKEKIEHFLAEHSDYVSTHLPNFQEKISLIDHLMTSERQVPGEGYYISLYKHYSSELDSLSSEELILFFELVMTDLILLTEDKTSVTRQLLEEIEERMNEREERNSVLERRNQQSESKINHLTDKVDSLTQENNTLRLAAEQRTKQLTRLELEKNTYEEKLKEREEEAAQLNDRKEQLLEKQANINELTLFDQEHIYLLTKMTSHHFIKYLNDTQIIVYEDLNDLRDILDDLDESAIYFINNDDISTKESFFLEAPFQSREMTYRIVSGGPTSVIRKMIYYLESDLKHEVKEPN